VQVSAGPEKLRAPVLAGLVDGQLDGLLEAHDARAPRPFAGGDERGFQSLFSSSAADHLLSRSLVRFPVLKVVREGVVVPRAELVRSVPVASQWIKDAADPARVREEYRRGATVVLQGVHTFWPPLRALASALEEEICHPVQINAYLTPPWATGSGAHYDTHDVLVLQVEGAKEWELGPMGADDPLPMERYRGARSLDAPEARVVLAPGQSLYVPRGLLHAPRTGSSASLHLTVGLLVRTRMDVVRDLAEEAALDSRFRAGLPLGFARDPEAASAAVRDVLAAFVELSRAVDPSRLVRRSVLRFQALRGSAGVERVLEAEAPVTMETRLRWAAEARVEAKTGVRIVVGQTIVDLPAHCLHLVSRMSASPFRLADFIGEWEGESLLLLGNRLLRAGVLRLPGDAPE
jgi:hypothetical protein